jgi:3,4-dihydroxyphenylacetate 2,3-dioxygenase
MYLMNDREPKIRVLPIGCNLYSTIEENLLVGAAIARAVRRLEMLPDYNVKCSGEGAMADTAMLFGILGGAGYGHGEQLCDYFPSTGTGQVVVDFAIT